MAETAQDRTARLRREALEARDRMQSEGFNRRRDYSVGAGTTAKPKPKPAPPPPGIFDRITRALSGR